MNSRIRSALRRSCFVTLVTIPNGCSLVKPRPARAYPPAVTLDLEAYRPLLIEYLVRTLWALLVVVIAIAVARAVRGVVVRALARARAHPNVTTLLGNVGQLVVF